MSIHAYRSCPIGPAAPGAKLFSGVAPAIVTDNNDADRMARVKVKFPWLSDDEESHWARIATPMAGNDRGFYVIPEVNDEVLVAFEHGDIRFPYVIGGLWNGQDAPPESNSDGANNKRLFKSRSGHSVVFDDTDGAEKITIIDKTGNNSIVIDSANNSITISADGDISISSADKLTLNAPNGIDIVSDSTVNISGSAINLD